MRRTQSPPQTGSQPQNDRVRGAEHPVDDPGAEQPQTESAAVRDSARPTERGRGSVVVAVHVHHIR